MPVENFGPVLVSCTLGSDRRYNRYSHVDCFQRDAARFPEKKKGHSLVYESNRLLEDNEICFNFNAARQASRLIINHFCVSLIKVMLFAILYFLEASW
jgi:hypothetical protein